MSNFTIVNSGGAREIVSVQPENFGANVAWIEVGELRSGACEQESRFPKPPPARARAPILSCNFNVQIVQR